MAEKSRAALQRNQLTVVGGTAKATLIRGSDGPRSAPLDSRRVVPAALSSRHSDPPTAAEVVAQFAPSGGHDADVTAAYRATLPGLDALLERPGITVLRGERGQTLTHLAHVARGLFLFLEGELALTSPCGCTEVLDAKAGFFLFPTVAEIDEPAGRTATFRHASLALYIPRSLVLLDEAVGQQLSNLLVREVSLRAPPEPPEAHP